MSSEKNIRFTNLDRRETEKLTGQVMDFIDSMVDKSPAYWHKLKQDPMDVLDEMVQSNVFVRSYLPGTGRIIELDQWAKVDANALITIFGLLRYRSVEGSFPTSLEKLV